MCGIAGWYRRRGRLVSRQTIARQCLRLAHRGPDDNGVLIDGDLGIGMRRLSIVDVGGGHQPITSDDGRYSIVCNGEVFNHPELRAELAGYRFRTASDVETLLGAFIRWGDGAWPRLEGMYAAAIWDHHAKLLTLARDPLGIKPLWVSEQDGGLAFASEMPALREVPGFAFDLDERSVHDFFSFGHVLGPRSMFRQVRALEPGHVLRIGPTGESQTTRFWRPQIRIQQGLSEGEWIEETRRRVLATVDKHMMSDVPVGAYLSGGVDSSAIAASMARTSGPDFKAFTAAFPGSKIDETAAASAVAQHIGCRHVVVPIRPEAAADVLPAVQAAFDEPTAANSAIPLWYLSRAAREHVKVVLCGEGGDELFLGYNRQRWGERMRRAAPLVRALGGMRFLDGIPESSHRKLNYLRGYAKRFRDGALLGDGYQRFFAAVTITSPAIRARIYDRDFWLRQDSGRDFAALVEEFFPNPQPGLTPIEEFAIGDLTVHMPASLLQRLDRSTMAHSLEARVPFLSHRFCDWALTIPDGMKLKGGVGKYVLRKAVEPWLPKGVPARGKQGFQMPLADWFTGGLNDFARDIWESSGAADAGYLDPAAVRRLFDEHREGRADHGRILYALAMFSCWWTDQRQIVTQSVSPGLRAHAL